jgi:hypothetical protein
MCTQLGLLLLPAAAAGTTAWLATDSIGRAATVMGCSTTGIAGFVFSGLNWARLLLQLRLLPVSTVGCGTSCTGAGGAACAALPMAA